MRSAPVTPLLPHFFTVWAGGGPPRTLRTSRIALARWLPAAAEPYPIGRLLKPSPSNQRWDGWRRHEVELCIAEKHGGSRVRGLAVWLRHSRHLGHHQRAVASLRPIVEEPGDHGFHCDLGHRCRCDARRIPGRTLWTARQFTRIGSFLFDLRAWLRFRLELVVFGGVPLHRRPGYRRLVGTGSDVHC